MTKIASLPARARRATAAAVLALPLAGGITVVATGWHAQHARAPPTYLGRAPPPSTYRGYYRHLESGRRAPFRSSPARTGPGHTSRPGCVLT
jgi:hypothetical protein